MEGSNGGGLVKWVMGIKEGTCWDEHWVLCVSDESLNSTSEAKKKKKKKRTKKGERNKRKEKERKKKEMRPGKGIHLYN